ncbi:MAG: hypothetical protein DCF22_06870 [Leptolyngbya sp.]|nr:MAG: hypothetical protein DCF22_06870 [Leptolyngbya sp.]
MLFGFDIAHSSNPKVLVMYLKHSSIRFPLWKFLTQPVFDAQYRISLNPQYFWRVHRIEVLERCLKMPCTSQSYTD